MISMLAIFVSNRVWILHSSLELGLFNQSQLKYFFRLDESEQNWLTPQGSNDLNIEGLEERNVDASLGASH